LDTDETTLGILHHHHQKELLRSKGRHTVVMPDLWWR
jgi:hypothetical protein